MHRPYPVPGGTGQAYANVAARSPGGSPHLVTRLVVILPLGAVGADVTDVMLSAQLVEPTRSTFALSHVISPM